MELMEDLNFWITLSWYDFWDWVPEIVQNHINWNSLTKRCLSLADFSAKCVGSLGVAFYPPQNAVGPTNGWAQCCKKSESGAVRVGGLVKESRRGFKTLATCPQSQMKNQKASRRFVILSVNTEIIQNCNGHTFFRTNGDKGWGFKKMESEAVSEIGGGGLEETGRQLFPLFFNGGNHCSAQTKWLLNSLKLLR